ncbi:MAG: hypothetical protein ACJ8CR_14730 [Roseiflexaceae bacterium]
MPTSTDENHLAEKHYVTVVVRLVLDEHGRLIHGELIDVASVIGVRFSGWRGLIRAVRSWLAQQSSKETSDDER